MQLSLDVLLVKEITSKESGKKFRVVCGVVDIGGNRGYVEFFAPNDQPIGIGQNVVDLEFGLSYEHNFQLRVVSVKPIPKRAAA